MVFKMDAVDAAKNALQAVLECVPGEKVLIIADHNRKDIGEAFATAALFLGAWSRLVVLRTPEWMRQNVPIYLQEIIIQNSPDIFINLLRGPSEETPFRIQLINLETRKRIRLAHCPGVTLDMLTEGALALTFEEHRTMQELADRLISILQDVIEVKVENPTGTSVVFSTENRPFFTDTHLDWKTLKWMNLPTGEVMVAPVENSLNGTLVADLAVGGIGPLKEPITLNIENGRVNNINSKDQDVLARVAKALDIDPLARVVGEFAFGINKHARIVKEFLETEKVFGTIHIAFGNNSDFPGGKNRSKNHMDFLISRPTVTVKYRDGTEKQILSEGEYKI